MDKQANVQLIDTSDYSNYANGRRYQYFGGRGQADRRDLAGRSAAAARRHRVADKAEMRIGKCLRRRIDQGLAASRFAVVVLSPSYFARGWPQYELDGIVTLSVAGKQNLLPIWHDLGHAEVMAKSPSLADKFARTTADTDIEAIADEFADLINGSR